MSAAPNERVEVGDLDPAAVLALAKTNEREIRERELLRLELAYQWAVLHPATTDTGIETPGGPALGVLDADETLGGDGTPQVAAFAPEALATAMGWTPAAARNLMADVLDLVHRHPKLWRRVRRGRLLEPSHHPQHRTRRRRPTRPNQRDDLSCRCRRRHRANTHGLWRYTRTPDGNYLWHGPHGLTYLATPQGTHRLR